MNSKGNVFLWIKCLNSNATRSPPTSSELGADSDVNVSKTKRVGPGYSAHMKNMQEVDKIFGMLTLINVHPEKTWKSRHEKVVRSDRGHATSCRKIVLCLSISSAMLSTERSH